ncbi:MAG TPA: alpha/beta hydrolase [Caulobacteraceae bacterium]|nr:alpha/beta hydrolase [Caulobacteraceae bacterium]
MNRITPGVEARFVGLPSPTAPRIQAGGHPCQGLYWTAAGERPRVAVIATHYNVDFAEHYLAPYFARRGFGFLGWNTRYRGAEDLFMLEHALIDIGVGVRWLREAAGVETVVILGNSGGGSLMAAYQAEAASPTLAAAERAGAAAEALGALPGADLYISLNAHTGRPEVLTEWMDASVVDEADPVQTDPALDPFAPANGPPYGGEFIVRYRAAQRARNQRITDWARRELARVATAGIADLFFPLYRTWADLRFMDPAIDPSERPCPGCYRGDPRRANRTPGIGRVSSLRTWLSMWSLSDSRCQAADQLGRVALPCLVVQSTADMGVFPSHARAVLGAIAAPDKRLEFVPGAHYFEDDEAAREGAVELMGDWIRARV